MFAIHSFGSEEQKEQWLPEMAAGRKIGCFGLTEPDFGSDPAGMRTRATRSGDDWILNGTKMWITNGSVADVAVMWARTDDGVRGFAVPTDTPGFTAHTITSKMSLARVGHQRTGARRRPPPRQRPAARGHQPAARR